MSKAADLIVAGKAAYTFDEMDPGSSALAIREGVIVGRGASLADLQEFRGPSTHVVEESDLVLLPGFFDTHNHLSWTSQDDGNVDVSEADTIDGVVAKLRARAEQTPPGHWVVGRRLWHETLLRENRLPTARELDAASADHPIFLPRGGHVGVANSRALELAGITEALPDPHGGTIVRDAEGCPTGPLIEFPAMAPVSALIPASGHEERVAALSRTCATYASRGICAVRDPGIGAEDVDVYRDLRHRGALKLRARPLMMLDPVNGLQANLDLLDRMGVSPGEGDPMLRFEGVKIFADGGVEGGWLSEPYETSPDYCGHAFFDHDELTELVTHAARLGWKVGCHAVGDNAVRMVIDVYERVRKTIPDIGRRALAIEHAFFADAQTRRRAIDLGIPVTVQPALLYALAGNMLTHWGPDRTARVMPVAEWLEEGGELAGGSDCNVAPFDPLLAIWAFVTRGTKMTGIQGVRSAIDRRTAFRLYTTDAARLTGEEHFRGRLAVGQAADLVAFRDDPLTCDLDDLPNLSPVLTMVGGRGSYDPEGLLRDHFPELL